MSDQHTDIAGGCPACGGTPFIRRSHDADGMRWSHVECKSCGLRTRGKWAASSEDECPIFFQEVWEEWPRRAPVPKGYVLVSEEALRTLGVLDAINAAAVYPRKSDFAIFYPNGGIASAPQLPKT